MTNWSPFAQGRSRSHERLVIETEADSGVGARRTARAGAAGGRADHRHRRRRQRAADSKRFPLATRRRQLLWDKEDRSQWTVGRTGSPRSAVTTRYAEPQRRLGSRRRESHAYAFG